MLYDQEKVVFSERFGRRLPNSRSYVYPITFFIQSTNPNEPNRQVIITGISEDKLKTKELEELYLDASNAINRVNKSEAYNEAVVCYKAGIETNDQYITYHRSISYTPPMSPTRKESEIYEFIFPIEGMYSYTEMLLNLAVSKNILTKKVIVQPQAVPVVV